jgi:hypothetical protein
MTSGFLQLESTLCMYVQGILRAMMSSIELKMQPTIHLQN